MSLAQVQFPLWGDDEMVLRIHCVQFFFLKCASVRNFVHYNSLDLRMNTVFANGIGESLFLCKLVFFPYHPRYSALLINTNWEIRVKSIVDVLGFYTFTLDFTMPGQRVLNPFFIAVLKLCITYLTKSYKHELLYSDAHYFISTSDLHLKARHTIPISMSCHH